MSEFQEMQRRMGRMLRCISLPSAASLRSGIWLPAVDVYESDNEVIIYVDVAGVDVDKLNVMVERNNVTVCGRRVLPDRENIRSIHQLEIEYGYFERTVSTPVPVEISSVSSICRNGILEIRMPMEKAKESIRIKVD